LRKRHGWTQQDLADRLNSLGAHTDRAGVAKVETGKRGLSLNEFFQYAQALDVAPVHLVAPPNSDESISLGPNMECSPAELRAWIRGRLPIFQDVPTYFTEVPPGELPEELRRHMQEVES
jgi:transcriptional regulator with XRE-family HTH domain